MFKRALLCLFIAGSYSSCQRASNPSSNIKSDDSPTSTDENIDTTDIEDQLKTGSGIARVAVAFPKKGLIQAKAAVKRTADWE